MYLAVLYACFTVSVSAQVFMEADTTGDAYSLIDKTGYGYEVPDCKHAVRHITEEWNPGLRKNVFVFTLHRDLDDDRCINKDRQRTEIKTYGSSPDSMIGYYGESFSHRWKFFLDSGFQSSLNFCHIHQIKAGDGTDADNPLLTLTTRNGNGSNDKFQIIFIAPLTGTNTTIYQTDLTPFKGLWVEAYERITYKDTGSYSLLIKRLSDDKTLVTYSNDTLALWRAGSTFMHPKYGLYRSLLSSSYLRDESVRYADFYLWKTKSVILPVAPAKLQVTALSAPKVQLTWLNSEPRQVRFRIDRSTNGTTWSYAGSTAATNFVDSLPGPGSYYYRVRSENASGNSVFSPTVPLVISTVHEAELKSNSAFNLFQNYPNPWNPVTTISFFLERENNITLKLFDCFGKEIKTLLRGKQTEGMHEVVLDAGNLSSGIYYYQLRATNGCQTKKLLLLK